jgi:hypothetical protein
MTWHLLNIIATVAFTALAINAFISLKRNEWWGSELIEAYVEAARAWDPRFEAATDSKTIVSYRRILDRLWMIYHEAVRRDPRLSVVISLLNSKEDSVRLLVARQLLRDVPEQSLRVLGEIAKKGGELGNLADALIVAQKEGRLR